MTAVGVRGVESTREAQDVVLAGEHVAQYGMPREELWARIATIARDPKVRSRTRLRALALIAARTDPVPRDLPTSPGPIAVNILLAAGPEPRALPHAHGVEVHLGGDEGDGP
jgi:hypothetical protein